jgi:hypothetical protein
LSAAGREGARFIPSSGRIDSCSLAARREPQRSGRIEDAQTKERIEDAQTKERIEDAQTKERIEDAQTKERIEDALRAYRPDAKG